MAEEYTQTDDERQGTWDFDCLDRSMFYNLSVSFNQYPSLDITMVEE